MDEVAHSISFYDGAYFQCLYRIHGVYIGLMA